MTPISTPPTAGAASLEYLKSLPYVDHRVGGPDGAQPGG